MQYIYVVAINLNQPVRLQSTNQSFTKKKKKKSTKPVSLHAYAVHGVNFLEFEPNSFKKKGGLAFRVGGYMVCV